MKRPSQILAERYHLRLSDSWAAWFDEDAIRLRLPGPMRQALTAEQLASPAPEQVWPGFMLPDTLPVVGNEYGDWICVRVTRESTFGELLYWYHGGGDWVPLGETMAEAILHDGVDQFRQVRKQMIRGASESQVDIPASTLARMCEPELRSWMVESLPTPQSDEHGTDNVLDSLMQALGRADYIGALEKLALCGWAQDATACDLIEAALRTPIDALADQAVAQKVGIAWFPDFVELMFDTSAVAEPMRSSISAAAGLDSSVWPVQDWNRARQTASSVLARRTDLGWASMVQGWALERDGKPEQAAQCYWNGRHASSFGDQSVRFNSHAATEEFGKFSLARLGCIIECLSDVQRDDPYLAIFHSPRKRSLLAEVHHYWLDAAQDAMNEHDYRKAFDRYYMSGWDMGVSRLSDYQAILTALAEAAELSGSPAQAEVARTHARRLRG